MYFIDVWKYLYILERCKIINFKNVRYAVDTLEDHNASCRPWSIVKYTQQK